MLMHEGTDSNSSLMGPDSYIKNNLSLYVFIYGVYSLVINLFIVIERKVAQNMKSDFVNRSSVFEIQLHILCHLSAA